MKKVKIKEKIYEWIFACLAFASLLFLVGIMVLLFRESFPLFKAVKMTDFLFGKTWYPTHEDAEFGILPIIWASIWVTSGALFVCVPLGVGSALYLNELAGIKQKMILKPLIELLASIPSVVYGFFGMVIAAPFLQKALHLSTGLCAFTASLVLGIMATPTVCSIAEDAEKVS